jgi:hypothetical protein
MTAWDGHLDPGARRVACPSGRQPSYPVRSVPAMRRAACALVLLAVAGCGSSGTDSIGSTDGGAPTVEATTEAADLASQLRDEDMSDGHVVAATPDYQAAFATLQTRCSDSPARLALYVRNALHLLQSKGINDETRYTLLQHLADSVPASAGPPLNCQEIAGAYAIRENKIG